MLFVRCLRSVLASFLGIRRGAQAAAVVLTLVCLTRWVAGGGA